MQSLAVETHPEPLVNRPFEDNIAEVNQLCDTLRDLKPGSVVPYVDPAHGADECRIISLYSNIGTADESGFITAGDEAASTHLLGVQWQLGLRPEFVMPWNVRPWFVPGEPNGKLTTDQIAEGLRPLLSFLALVPRASALVAHGTEAHRLSDMFLKTQNSMIYRRGFKTYKVRSTFGRSFAGSAARQQQWLDEMRLAYGDAMARAGLPRRGA